MDAAKEKISFPVEESVCSNGVRLWTREVAGTEQTLLSATFSWGCAYAKEGELPKARLAQYILKIGAGLAQQASGNNYSLNVDTGDYLTRITMSGPVDHQTKMLTLLYTIFTALPKTERAWPLLVSKLQSDRDEQPTFDQQLMQRQLEIYARSPYIHDTCNPSTTNHRAVRKVVDSALRRLQRLNIVVVGKLDRDPLVETVNRLFGTVIHNGVGTEPQFPGVLLRRTRNHLHDPTATEPYGLLTYTSKIEQTPLARSTARIAVQLLNKVLGEEVTATLSLPDCPAAAPRQYALTTVKITAKQAQLPAKIAGIKKIIKHLLFMELEEGDPTTGTVNNFLKLLKANKSDSTPEFWRSHLTSLMVWDSRPEVAAEVVAANKATTFEKLQESLLALLGLDPFIQTGYPEQASPSQQRVEVQTQ